MAEKFLGQSGLNKLITLIKNALSTKVDKIDGKGLSTNDYTTSEKTKLSGIASGAQVNTLEGIQKNGKTVTITNKIANISVPTKTSDLTNDNNFITLADVPEGAAASTTTPKMDGTAAVGSETAFARGDHVHPHDSTKVDKVSGKDLSTNDYTTAEKEKLAGIEAGAQVNPTKVSAFTNDAGYLTQHQDISGKVDKVSGKGLSTNDYTTAEKNKLSGIEAGAQVNVVTDVSDGADDDFRYVVIEKGEDSFTVLDYNSFVAVSIAIGNVLSRKVDVESGKGLSTNDYTDAEKEKLGNIAANAQVNVIEAVKVNGTALTVTNKAVDVTVPTASSTNPKMDGTAAVGTANTYAKGDHVHPTDTSRAAASDLTSHTGNTTVHITAAERTAWNAKQNALTAGTDYLTPAQVNSAIDSKISSVYTPKGSIAFASLPTAAEGLVGDVYNITDAFTTTAAFVEGAGQSYPAGTNVVCVKEGSAYKWDVLAGFIDITELTTTEVQTIWDSVFNPGA